MKLLSYVRLFVTLWSVAYQAPLSIGFSRQEYWSGVGCHFLFQMIFPTQGSILGLPHCWQTLYHPSHQGSLIAQLVKNPPARRETQVRSLGQEDPLEKGQATHSNFLGLPLWLSY